MLHRKWPTEGEQRAASERRGLHCSAHSRRCSAPAPRNDPNRAERWAREWPACCPRQRCAPDSATSASAGRCPAASGPAALQLRFLLHSTGREWKWPVGVAVNLRHFLSSSGAVLPVRRPGRNYHSNQKWQRSTAARTTDRWAVVAPGRHTEWESTPVGRFRQRFPQSRCRPRRRRQVDAPAEAEKCPSRCLKVEKKDKNQLEKIKSHGKVKRNEITFSSFSFFVSNSSKHFNNAKDEKS